MSSSPSTSKIDGDELERRLFRVYSTEVENCDQYGQSTQHIGDEWMRREIRKICGFDVSDRWIKAFRKKFNIRYFSGRRHCEKTDKMSPKSVKSIATTKYLKERRILRTSRKEYEDVDGQVNDEIIRRQRNGERLTNPWIREFAQSVANQLYPSDGNISSFFDSNWLYRFKRRYNVELKPRSSTTTVVEGDHLDESTGDAPSTPSRHVSTSSTIIQQPIATLPSNIDLIQAYKPAIDYYSQILQLQQYINYMSSSNSTPFNII